MADRYRCCSLGCCRDDKDALARLTSPAFGLSQVQAEAVLSMPLRRLLRLEQVSGRESSAV